MQSLSEAKRDARRQLADEINPLLLAQSFLGEDEYWFDDEANQIRILAKDIIRTELAGVFNWAMAGLDALDRQFGFTIPDVSRERLEEHRRDVDPARTFLLNNYAASLDYDGLPACEVYASYVRWSQDNGFRPVNSAHFGRQVKRAFPSTERIQQRDGRRRIWLYRGLAVQEGSEVATAERSLCP